MQMNPDIRTRNLVQFQALNYMRQSVHKQSGIQLGKLYFVIMFWHAFQELVFVWNTNISATSNLLLFWSWWDNVPVIIYHIMTINDLRHVFRMCFTAKIYKPGCDKSLALPDWTKQLKVRHFSSDAEVIATAETWLDRQISEFFFWVACKSLVVLACFLPGRAKDLWAPRYFHFQHGFMLRNYSPGVLHKDTFHSLDSGTSLHQRWVCCVT